jgi:hypothetical protein
MSTIDDGAADESQAESPETQHQPDHGDDTGHDAAASRSDDSGEAGPGGHEEAGPAGHDDGDGALLGPAGGAMPAEPEQAAPAGPARRSSFMPNSAAGLQALPPAPRQDGSSMGLQAEKAGLYAKKMGARALDTALFAPLHAIDQLSILDVHAADAANFVASGGKTRAQRDKKGMDDPIDYRPRGFGAAGSSEKFQKKKLREIGRTGLRDGMTAGVNPHYRMKHLDDTTRGFEWGKSLTGKNPVSALRKAGAPVVASPDSKDNKRIRQIKQELRVRKAEKKNETVPNTRGDRHGELT